jgi:glutamyl-Q tRNA(Asp) synthetase
MPILTCNQSNGYVGRFAPSPSGALHFGSLVAALGSYLQARKEKGQWLVRIEDIDPPREVAGASENILNTLEQHSLHWDAPPIYQSKRSVLYQEKIDWLMANGYTFNCHCTRAKLAALNFEKPCSCSQLTLPLAGCAVRIKIDVDIASFYDDIQMHVARKSDECDAMFAIKRKDGLFAYQLAVVVDDIAQGITQVVRGADLLQATFYQLTLYKAFGIAPPRFAHLPLVLSANGTKLSKQNHAQAIDAKRVNQNLYDAMCFLGLLPPVILKSATPSDMLNWAINAWELSTVPHNVVCKDNRIGALYSI